MHRIIVSIAIAASAASALAEPLVAPASTGHFESPARAGLNPQPLPPRWSAAPVGVAAPSTAPRTAIIIVGGRSGAGVAPVRPTVPRGH